MKVVYQSIVGAVLGIFAGLILGLLIWSLSRLVVSFRINIAHIPGNNDMPLDIFTILGMCFGALIGGINGGAIALAEEKKQK